MDLLSQQPLLSTDEATRGFDCEAGNRWIYPENYPVRSYQFTIVKTALFHNTLVCLPTGLGKTFIAAVVMYNYFRWYPKGIIVFLAPTKPLVAQQIEACHDIMGIPISDTTELTGATNPTKRRASWRDHRVIFATPQTFQKDLENSIVPTDLIKCIVIDEAHKALGRHAYCESIRMMFNANPYFRVLALSATPGSKLEAVQDVIGNLHITHLELRDDTSPDITPYINERKLDVILVELGGDLSRYKERYIEIMDRHVKILQQCNVLKTYTANISKGRIFHIMNEFKSRPSKPANHGVIMRTLNILLTMYHAYELLIRHGLRAFVNFYQNHSDKYWLDNEPSLQELIQEVTEFIGPFPDVRSLMDGTIDEIPENITFGHAKFDKLREILENHFEQAENKENTRAIVFIEYRDIVNEVFVLLMKQRPLIRPQVFVGQAGLKQKAQKKALDDFRNNHVNVLISTSVGEEGLDVGEVDLIICFDISQQSPTRLVQRMGRTGRKRNGHIIVLVTDGKEHQTLQSALFEKDSMNRKVLRSSGIISALQSTSPKMIPEGIDPQCQKIHMTVLPKDYPGAKGRKTTKGVADKGKKVITEKLKKTTVEKPKKTTRATKNQKNTETRAGGALMRYLQSIPQDDEHDDDLVPLRIEDTRFTQPISQKSVSQSLRGASSSIKPTDVKILTNDNDTLEFLTLCATRQSAKDSNNNPKLDIPYIIESPSPEPDFLETLKIPNDSVFNCLDGLEMFVKPPEPPPQDDFEIYSLGHGFTPDFQTNPSPQDVFVGMENRFEDLLNTSDEDVDMKNDESPPVETVDWSADFKGKEDKISENVDKVTEQAFENVLFEVSDDEEIQASPDVSPKRRKLSQLSIKACEALSKSIEDLEKNNYSPLKNSENFKKNHETPRKHENFEENYGKSPENRGNSEEPVIGESVFEHLLDDSEDSNETQFDFNPDVVDKKIGAEKVIDKVANSDKKEEESMVWDDSMDFPTDQLSLQIVHESISRSSEQLVRKLGAKSSSSPVLVKSSQFSKKPRNSQINEANKTNTTDNQRHFAKFNTKNNDETTAMEIDETETFDFEEYEKSTKNHGNNANSTFLAPKQPDIDNTESFDYFTAANDMLNPQPSTSSKKSEFNETESYDFSTQKTRKSAENRNISKKPELDETQSYDFFRETNEPGDSQHSLTSSKKWTTIDKTTQKIDKPPKTPISLKKSATNQAESMEFLPEVYKKPVVTPSKYSRKNALIDIFNENANSREETGIDEIESYDFFKAAAEQLPEGSQFSKKSAKESENESIDFFAEAKKLPEFQKSTQVEEIDLTLDEDDFDSWEFNSPNPSKSAQKSVVSNVTISNKIDINAPSTSSYNENRETTGAPENKRLADKAKLQTPVRKFQLNHRLNLTNSAKTADNNNKASENKNKFNDNEEIVFLKKCENKRIGELKKNSVNFNDRTKEKNKMNADLDDFDWGSDFEVSDIVSECKYFNSPKTNVNLNQNSKGTLNGNLKKNLNSNLHNKNEKTKQPESTLKNKFKTKSPEKTVKRTESTSSGEFSINSSKKIWSEEELVEIRKIVFEKPPKDFVPLRSWDSDDDFSATKIEKAAKPNAQVKGSLSSVKPLKKTDKSDSSRSNVLSKKSDSDLDFRKNDRGPSKKPDLSSFAVPERPQLKASGSRQRTSSSPPRKRHKSLAQRRDRLKSDFIEDEAEFSSDDENHYDRSEEEDGDLSGFISHTQYHDDSVDMKAHYLQSTKSPRRRANGFHFRQPKAPQRTDIFSQPMPDEPDSYLYDSFCVKDDRDDIFEEEISPEEITIIEEVKRKKKKRKRSGSAEGRKRKRVQVQDDSSSEDETERMRAAVMEESMMLKKFR